MLKTATSAIALSVVFLASQASAADVYGRGESSKDVPVVSDKARSWSGLWIGAVGGYQFSNSELTFDAKEVQGNEGSGTVPLGGTEKSAHFGIDGLGADGLFGEAQIGFDQQIGRSVIGVFAGYNLNDGEFNVDASSFNAWHDPQNQGANLLSFEQEWGGVLGVRAGLLSSPDTLIYLAGGWAFGELGKVKSDLGGADGTGGNIFDKQETDLNGWFGEIGLETRVYQNVYFTLAGRYTDYSAITLASETGECDGDGDDTCSAKLELDHDTLAVMAGLKVKFGGIPAFGN